MEQDRITDDQSGVKLWQAHCWLRCYGDADKHVGDDGVGENGGGSEVDKERRKGILGKGADKYVI